jgi:hypothetical protein
MPLNKFILYDTECGHVTRLPINAVLGYPFACNQCRKLTTIVNVHVNEWHAFCLFTSPRCRFSAWTGMSKDLANQAADRHGRNAVNHSIHIQVEYMINPSAMSRRKKLLAKGIITIRTNVLGGKS